MNPHLIADRRAFLRAAVPGAALMCLGGRGLLRGAALQDSAAAPGPAHKFLDDSGMSFAEVFAMVFGDSIRLLKGLEREIGSERLHGLLKKVVDEGAARDSAEFAKGIGRDDLAAFTQPLRRPDRFWQHVLTFQVVEDTPTAFEIKVTECLWAKTLRETGAADLGYLTVCHGDYASARGFNPKMRMVRTKTLMQGDDSCNHRYVMEG